MTALTERLLALGKNPHSVLERCGDLCVHEHERLRWLHSGGRSIQSVLCLDEPAQLQLPAQQHMLAALLLLAEPPRSVLNLGFGGGGFERCFGSSPGDVRWLAVEADADVLALARRHLRVPPSAEVLVGSAEQAVASLDEQFDLILCDLFAGERHAPCLEDERFHGRLAERLEAGGVLAINLSPKSEAQLVGVLLHLRRHLPWVMLSNVPDCGNVVLLASRSAQPENVALRARSDRLGGRTQQDLAALIGTLERLPPPRLD